MKTAGYITATLLFCLGLYTTITHKNIFKILIGLTLMESAIFLIIINSAFIESASTPILPVESIGVNPLPHAFTLTAIVIGACNLALGLAFIIKLNRHYKTTDITSMRALRG